MAVKPETARRVRQRIGAVMKWAVAMGHRVGLPTVDRQPVLAALLYDAGGEPALVLSSTTRPGRGLASDSDSLAARPG